MNDSSDTASEKVAGPHHNGRQTAREVLNWCSKKHGGHTPTVFALGPKDADGRELKINCSCGMAVVVLLKKKDQIDYARLGLRNLRQYCGVCCKKKVAKNKDICAECNKA